MKKTRILYIGNNLAKKTNYSTSISILSNLLVQEGYQVTISSNKTSKAVRLLDMIWVTIKMRNHTDVLLIDTFSTLNFYYAFLISQLARIFQLKYIPILHGGNLPYRLEKSKILSGLIFKNSYYNVAPSNYLKTEFEKREYKTICIPNTLPIKNYIYKERNPIKPSILWVRAFKYLYNPMLAIEVLTLVKKEFPKVILCMVGPEKDGSFIETKKLADSLQLSDSVEFTGVLSKKVWHKKATNFDIFINTTNFDNTPISVLEAMALGLSVVSTNVGGIPYLIENNEDGILVDRENPEQMAQAIINIIKEKKLHLAKNARLKAENFDWNVAKEQWNTILQ